VTPTAPLTYSWVMAHHWKDWGVQIGPKTDGAGTHVAVYGWQGCSSNSIPRTPCAWQWFQEYQALTPGSVHTYSIALGPQGWVLSCDGIALATLNPGSTDPIYEQSTETTQN
jgi:hypothetical protein